MSGRKHEELVHVNREKETTLSTRNSPGLSGTIEDASRRVAIRNWNIRPSLQGLGERRCDSVNIGCYFLRCFAKTCTVDYSCTNMDPSSLRKQPTSRDATGDFPAKCRLRNERRSSILRTITTQIWLVLLIGWSKFPTNQKHHPYLGSDVSSVLNFCSPS